MDSGTLHEPQVTRKNILTAVRENPVNLSQLRHIVLGDNPTRDAEYQFNWIWRALVSEGAVRIGTTVKLRGPGYDYLEDCA